MTLALLSQKTVTAMIGVRSYLPDVQYKEQEPCFSEEEALEMDNVLGAGK